MLNVIRSYFPYPSKGPTAEYPEAAGYHQVITSVQKARVQLCMFWSPKSIAENSVFKRSLGNMLNYDYWGPTWTANGDMC